MSNEIQDFKIERMNLPDVEFRGKRIAFVSSRIPDDKPRWTEIAVYFTTLRQFVLVTTGKSVIEKEIDLTKVEVFKSVDELKRHFYKSSNSGPTGPAVDILKQLNAIASVRV